MNQPQKRILYIGNKLSKHGFTPTNVETLGPQLSRHFDITTVSNKKNKALRLAEMLGTIVRLRNKADLVLIDTYSTQAFKFAKLAGWMANRYRIPYIAILHGGDLPKMLKTATDSDFEFFKRAAKLVTPSLYLFELFKQFRFDQLQYIPNNIELANYPFQERKILRPNLLWVRSFHKIYHPSMAVQVLKKLCAHYPDATLCMVGPDKDGSLARVQKLAETNGLTSKITFTGKLSKQDWIKLSANYDLFINTTNVDNTPVSVMEALALGMPVISTNAGGLPFLLNDGKNAILVPVGDVDAMTGAIIALIREPELGQYLASNGKELVHQMSWEIVQHQWLELIELVSKN